MGCSGGGYAQEWHLNTAMPGVSGTGCEELVPSQYARWLASRSWTNVKCFMVHLAAIFNMFTCKSAYESYNTPSITTLLAVTSLLFTAAIHIPPPLLNFLLQSPHTSTLRSNSTPRNVQNIPNPLHTLQARRPPSRS
jgi:hypothetical protein